MALAAELGGLIISGGTARRVIGAAEEEHRRVMAGRQSGSRTAGNREHVHDVRVMTGIAQDDGAIVVLARLDEQAIVLHELTGLWALHADDPLGLGAVPSHRSSAVDDGVEPNRVFVQVVSWI